MDRVAKQLGKYVDETMLVLLKQVSQTESRVKLAEEKVTQYKCWEEVLDEEDTKIIQKLHTYEDNIVSEQVTLMDLLKLIGVTNYTPGDDLSQGWALVKEKVTIVLAAKENKNKDGMEILSSIQTRRADNREPEAKAPLKDETKYSHVTKINQEAKCIHKVKCDPMAKNDYKAKGNHEVKSDFEARQQTEVAIGVGTLVKTIRAPTK
ncbi:unnamed protein product [Calypogeia fissa]